MSCSSDAVGARRRTHSVISSAWTCSLGRRTPPTSTVLGSSAFTASIAANVRSSIDTASAVGLMSRGRRRTHVYAEREYPVLAEGVVGIGDHREVLEVHLRLLDEPDAVGTG